MWNLLQRNIRNRSQSNKGYAGLALPRGCLPKSKQVWKNHDMKLLNAAIPSFRGYDYPCSIKLFADG